MGLRDQWYENAILYCLDIEAYTDSDGDGVGGFRAQWGVSMQDHRDNADPVWLCRSASCKSEKLASAGTVEEQT